MALRKSSSASYDLYSKTVREKLVSGADLRRIILDFPQDLKMRIRHKTIYRLIYKKHLVKGEVKVLRRKGKSLKPTETKGKFNVGKSIKDRPKEVRKREQIGHWELDTVVSSREQSKYCLATFDKWSHS